MVIIEMCLSKKNGDCYDYLNFQLNEDLIQERVANISLKFSTDLGETLKWMLKISENERPNTSDLMNHLKIS